MKILLATLICFSAHAEESHYFYICRNQKVVRTLRLDKKPDSCQAIYTKDGVDKVVGNSKKTFSCVDVLEGVKKNLLTAGWKCKEVKGEQITQETEAAAEEKNSKTKQ